MLTNEGLYLLIVCAGGKRPPAGTSEATLRQLYRDATEKRMEAEDPVAAYDKAERIALKAVKVPRSKPYLGKESDDAHQ